jgi:hypothetical protein
MPGVKRNDVASLQFDVTLQIPCPEHFHQDQGKRICDRDRVHVAGKAAIRTPCVFHPEDESTKAEIGAGVGTINGVRTCAQNVPNAREMFEVVELGGVAFGLRRIDRDAHLISLWEANDSVHTERVIGVPARLILRH